jgi:hypothetical protein
MDRVNALTTGTKMMAAAGVLLFIDLFLSWQKTCVDTPIGDVCGKKSGWGGFWGVLLGLLTIALLIWIALEIAKVDRSGVNLPVTDANITLGLGAAVLVVAVVKLLTILGDASTIWSYIGVGLAAVIAVGAWMRSQEVEEAPVGSAPPGETPPGDTPQAPPAPPPPA